jgi:enterochelin esterase-like enzyme
MIRNRVKILLVLLLLLTPLAAAGAAAASPAVASGRLVTVEGFDSAFVPKRDIFVWLPAGYSEDGRYAVLYMHDGDNLWDAATTWNGQEWGVDEAVSDLLGKRAIRDVIVVGIPNRVPNEP